MSLEKSEAILLKAFNWSESSRTVVFFALDFGRIALVDKGGRSVKSRRGRIMPMARQEVTFYLSRRETRGYVREVELLEAFSVDKEGSVGRLAYSSAATELLHLLLPEEEPQPQLYHYYVSFLRHVQNAQKKALPSLFIAFFLRLLTGLGYHPSLGYCVACGKEASRFAGKQTVYFAVDQGGMVCDACQRAGDYYIAFSGKSFGRLLELQTASLDEAASIALGFKEAGTFLDALTAFMSSQIGVKSELKSLEFIEKLKNSQLIG